MLLPSCNRLLSFAAVITDVWYTAIFSDILTCTTIYRYPIFSTRYSVTCNVYTGHHGTNWIEHDLCACTVDNPLAKARGLSLRTGAQIMLCLSQRETTFLNSSLLPWTNWQFQTVVYSKNQFILKEIFFFFLVWTPIQH